MRMARVDVTFINAGDNAELDAELDDGLKVEQVIRALIAEGFIPLLDNPRSYMLTIKGRRSLHTEETLAAGGVQQGDKIRVSVSQRGGGSNNLFLSTNIRTYQPQHHSFPYQSYLFSKKPHPSWRYSVPDEEECESNQPCVAILESALEAIFYHASNDKQNERFGILIGGVFHDPQSGENWIEILDILPAIQIYGNYSGTPSRGIN
jgi:hypothetical protein